MPQGTVHQALYRRWRAQTFSEMVGQEAVVATLRNAVATGQVAHALLFTGPRGTGKTSLARIVAKAINCENLGPTADPCDACASCIAIRDGSTLDVIEIDAASNRGINEVRELRERLNYAPAQLRRKVYILDEAHQITKDAWNALLKSLEEPPDFVTFMFASTHPQEFPPAILSRLQRFDVRRLTVAEITGKLDRILAADGREAEPEAVALVARLAAGGMRDAESILDQLLSSTTGRIEAGAVRDLLGLADADLVDGFVAALAAGDAMAGISLLDRLEERGRDLRIFLDQVVDAIRDQLVAGLAAGTAGDPSLAVGARRLASIDPMRLGPGGLRLQLELALLEPAPDGGPQLAAPEARTRPGDGFARPPGSPATSAESSTEPAAPPQAPGSAPRTGAPTPPKLGKAPAASETEVAGEATLPEPSTPARRPGSPTGHPPAPEGAPARTVTRAAAGPDPRTDVSAPAAGPGAGDDLERLRAGWISIVTAISASPSLKPLIIECRPIAVEGNVVTLGFPEEKPFMREAAERKRTGIEEPMSRLLGHPISIRCVVSNLDLLPPLPADEEAAHILAEAQRIFAEDLAEIPEVT